jgi:hypothetical protein
MGFRSHLKPMDDFHLAQINIARLIALIDDRQRHRSPERSHYSSLGVRKPHQCKKGRETFIRGPLPIPQSFSVPR